VLSEETRLGRVVAVDLVGDSVGGPHIEYPLNSGHQRKHQLAIDFHRHIAVGPDDERTSVLEVDL
jgi:hypothetical protein